MVARRIAVVRHGVEDAAFSMGVVDGAKG